MYRFLPLAALLLSLGLSGCGRQSDTHDPAETERTPPGETATEAMDTPVAPPDENESDTETEAPICTEEWFQWVNDQVIAMHDGDMAQLYPSGLPDVGTAEWFLAVDKLTGGDGAHGPDGGSAEWCSMMQHRLKQSSP